MVKNNRCKKCGELLHTIKDMTPYGDHGWKFICCNLQYYTCNRDTCNHPLNGKTLYFYQNKDYLKKHIEKYHVKQDEEEDNPILLDKYMHRSIFKGSYQESSSLGKYFIENCSIQGTSFTYKQQQDAIKRIITTACNQSKGIISVTKQISNSSFIIFFAIAQIAFIANELVLKYLSIILSIIIPLWRNTHKCALDIPTTPDSIRAAITSTNAFSIRSLIPMPNTEEVGDHCYSSLSTLLAYTTMTSTATSQATKPRYIAWMKSISCTTFANKVETLSQGSTKPAVVVFMIFGVMVLIPTIP